MSGSNGFEEDLTAFHQQNKKLASQWAAKMLGSNMIMLDTETTGLNEDDEVIEIAAIDRNGKVLMNTLVKPLKPIPDEIAKINHITNEKVANARPLPEVLKELQGLLKGKILITYNLDFDLRVLRQSAAKYHLKLDFETVSQECAMRQYAQWYGQYNKAKKAYYWQKLIAADHSALVDCYAALDLMKIMKGTDNHEKTK